MSQQPPHYPPGNPPPGGAPPGGWGTPPGPAGPPGSGGFPPPGGNAGGPTGRNNTPIIVMVVVIAVGLVGGGIFLLTQGGDDQSEEEQAYIDAITETGVANQEGELQFDETEARCLATAVVDTFGVETLREEATPEEIRSNPDDDPLEDLDVSLQQAEGIYEGTSGCIDYRGLLMASLEDDSGMSPEQIDCVNRNLSDQHISDLLVSQLAQDDDAAEAAGAAADEATEDCNEAG